MSIHQLAGKPAPRSVLANVPELISAYFSLVPDMRRQTERISFGTSGHRGSSLKRSFNELHVMAMTQAVCDYRREAGIDGVLFIGMDTHPLSWPAQLTALRVLAANHVQLRLAAGSSSDGSVYTPTPVISHAILTSNRNGGPPNDGIVITPSHNPPEDGGFKYNPPHGGPADTDVTSVIEARANQLLEDGARAVGIMPLAAALEADTVQKYDYVKPYVRDLQQVVDMEAIAQSGVRIGADAMGGSGMAYWKAIREQYGLSMEIFHDSLDSAFSFMHCDKDGKIRMDCSSPYAMAGLVSMKEDFDIAFGNDTDFDRHGIVTRSMGLMNPNHYLGVAISYLAQNRPQWRDDLGIGKTLVSSSIIDRAAAHLGRKVVEVPVGFKWFVEGLLAGSIFFGGEESAGASFLRKDGTVWSTDKDGIILNLLAAEITAKTGRDPGWHYQELTRKFGSPVYARIDAPATPAQKAVLKKLRPEDVKASTLAGEPITAILTKAPGNGASIGGLKIAAENGWCALRPSGTEDIYKIYAESFVDAEHLARIQEEAKAIVSSLI